MLTARDHKSALGPSAILLAVTLLVFSSSLRNGFLSNWDDNLYITANPVVQAVTLDNIRSIFTNYYVGNYAPLQMLSYMVDVQLWGLNPSGFIAHNLALAWLNSVLLYVLLRKYEFSPECSLAGALIFLIHPVQVESVAWISQRKSLLAMFFFLLAWLSYLRYQDDPPNGRGRFLLANAAFLLALMTKSVAVILPLVLLVNDFIFHRKSAGIAKSLLGKLPFLVMAVFFAALAMISQNPEAGVGGGRLYTYHGGSAVNTVFTMLTVYRLYLVNLFWPVHLSAVYSPEVKSQIDIDVLLSGVLLLATICLPLLFSRVRRYQAWFWMAVFLIGFLPVSQIVPLVTLMNDRYFYFPMLGGAGLVALSLQDSVLLSRNYGRMGLILIVVLLGALSFQRARVWENPLTLWGDAARQQPASDVAWYGLGIARYEAGDAQAAVVAYQRALQANPQHLDAIYNLALIYVLQGEFVPAQNLLEPAAVSHTERLDLVGLAGHVAYFQGSWDKARRLYVQASRLEPNVATYWNCLGLVEERVGNLPLAQAYWKRALEYDEKPGDLLLSRARLESLARDRMKALAYVKAAIDAGLDDPGRLRFDADLEFVRTSPEFDRILSGLEK